MEAQGNRAVIFYEPRFEWAMGSLRERIEKETKEGGSLEAFSLCVSSVYRSNVVGDDDNDEGDEEEEEEEEEEKKKGKQHTFTPNLFEGPSGIRCVSGFYHRLPEGIPALSSSGEKGDNQNKEEEDREREEEKQHTTHLERERERLSHVAVLFIGEEGKTLTNLMLQYNMCSCYTFNPKVKGGRLREENVRVNRTLNRRFYLVEKAKNAEIIGIVAGTLGVCKSLSRSLSACLSLS